MNKSKYIIPGYTPEILRQDPDLPNFQRDAFEKVAAKRVAVPPKNQEEQDNLEKLRECARRNLIPLFNYR